MAPWGKLLDKHGDHSPASWPRRPCRVTTGEVAGPGTGSTGNLRPEQLSACTAHPGPSLSVWEAVAHQERPGRRLCPGSSLHLHSSKMGESLVCLEAWGGQGSKVSDSLVPPLQPAPSSPITRSQPLTWSSTTRPPHCPSGAAHRTGHTAQRSHPTAAPSHTSTPPH